MRRGFFHHLIDPSELQGEIVKSTTYNNIEYTTLNTTQIHQKIIIPFEANLSTLFHNLSILIGEPILKPNSESKLKMCDDKVEVSFLEDGIVVEVILLCFFN